MSRYRTTVAGAVVAITVGFGALLGLGGVAGAQTSTTGGTNGGTATTAAKCAKAPAAEAKIQHRLATIQQHLTTLDARITKATDAHHPKVVARLTTLQTTAKDRSDALTARLAAIPSRCPANA